MSWGARIGRSVAVLALAVLGCMLWHSRDDAGVNETGLALEWREVPPGENAREGIERAAGALAWPENDA